MAVRIPISMKLAHFPGDPVESERDLTPMKERNDPEPGNNKGDLRPSEESIGNCHKPQRLGKVMDVWWEGHLSSLLLPEFML